MRYQRGDICWCELPESKGSVQKGKRPCLIIQNNVGNMFSPTTIVLAITKANKNYKQTHLMVERSRDNGLKTTSFIIAEQIFTVSTKYQLKNKIGHLEPENMDIVNKALAISIGL